MQHFCDDCDSYMSLKNKTLRCDRCGLEKEYESIARTLDVVIEVIVQKIQKLEQELENLRQKKENLVVVDFAKKKKLK